MVNRLHDLFEKNTNERGNMEYIKEKTNGEWIGKSYAQLEHDIKAFAKYLLKNGCLNKKVVIYADNSYKWIVADLAVMAYIGVSVPLDKEYKKSDIANVVSSSDVYAILYSDSQSEIISTVSSKFPQIKLINLDEVFENALVEGKNHNAELSPKGTDDAAKIIFTSGTTGSPKGVVLSQKNMMSSWKGFYCAPFEIGDAVYLALPFHHIFAGAGVIINTQLMQLKLFIGHDIKNMVAEMHETNPQVFDGVPIMFERFYNAREHFPDFKKMFGNAIKYLYCGGAPLDLEIKKFYLNSGVNIFETYGMTETSSLISLEAINDPNITSVGKPFNAEVKIISADSDGYGEIAVKGDCVFKGYYQNGKIKEDVTDDEGFFHTGDIGYIDSEGYLYVRGRKDRVIITKKGKNIFPDEIEAMLKNHAGIIKAKVLLKNNTLCAELIVNDSKADFDSVIKKMNDALPHYKQILNYEISEDAPEKITK